MKRFYFQVFEAFAKTSFVLGFCTLSNLTAPLQLEGTISPIFENTISIAEFGGIANTVSSLQPGTYINDTATSLRTNDYQNLQSIYGNYATQRPITRMGAFLISQASSASAVTPVNGPGVTFPAFRFSNDPTQSPANPAQNITTNNTTALLVFSSNETSTYTLTGDFGTSATRQSALLTYANPSNSAQTIVDYNIVGNAYHDILYNDLTPLINTDGYTHLQSITVYSTTYPSGHTITNPVPPNNYPIPAGHKFKIALLDTQTNQTQTWLLYLQPPDNTTPTLPQLAFNAFFNGSGTNILVAQSSFTGFFRVGIVQNTPVPYSPQPSNTATEVVDWSTSLGIQVIASTPASMYVLWPTEFVQKATTKVKTNFSSSTDLPYCPWLSVYLPMIALDDYNLSFNYFSCLMNDLSASVYPFDGGTNPFLSYFNMLLATSYASDIATYQTANRAYPSYTISPTTAGIEAAYDLYRDVIPTEAEISYTAGTYTWDYTTLVRMGASQTQPLIIFPAYKKLTTSFTPVTGFQVLDPIKGPLYGVVAQSGSVTFQEPGLPTFLQTQFFPADFWNYLTNADKTQLSKYWSAALKDQLAPGNILAISTLSDGYGNGKDLYQAALSINYGAYLLQKGGMSLANIKTITQPTINAIKTVVQNWLITIQKNLRQTQGANFPTYVQNFFVGDTTVQGLCYSVRGMLGGNDATTVGQDFGNAAYNDHHFAYGYWLGAVAAVVDWDNTFAAVGETPPVTPWIAQTFTSAVGDGPYKMKSFVDMLWRDTRNPDPNDPDFPYNRHGNPWEGHSTANGLNLMPYSAGRNQESLAEDFNCWLATLYYARGILATYANPSFSGALTASDVAGFNVLKDFCTLNLQLTATGGNLYYNTSNWPYASTGFNYNVTAAQQYDNVVDSATFFKPGTPACTCTSEEAINSPTRLDSFYENFLDF